MTSEKTGYEHLAAAELMPLARHFLLRLQPDLEGGRRVLAEIERRLRDK